MGSKLTNAGVHLVFAGVFMLIARPSQWPLFVAVGMNIGFAIAHLIEFFQARTLRQELETLRKRYHV